MKNARSVEAIVRGLERLRSRARAVLVARGALTVAVWGLGICLAAAAMDFVLRTPDWFRLVVWACGLAALVVGVWKAVGPALRFRPNLTELALRVEQSQAGQSAGLGGVLASGIELGRAVERGELSNLGAGLTQPVVLEAAARFGLVPASAVVTSARARRPGVWLLGVMAVIAAIGALQPGLAATGALRVLAPWAGAQWPKRTEIADATLETVHPLGVALPLRAAMLKGASLAESAEGGGRSGGARVWGVYRLRSATATGPVNRVLLSNQGKAVNVTREQETRAGVLFERLIEPAALLMAPTKASGADDAVQQRQAAAAAETDMEFWFESADDRSPTRRIRLVEPPAVLAAAAQVIEPAYLRASASPAATAGTEPAARAIDLGPGTDERANPPAMLAGSQLTLRITLNKAVPPPEGGMAERAAWIRAALGEHAASLVENESLRANFDGPIWELSWKLAETARLSIHPRDQYGLASGEEAIYRFEAIVDQPPTATVTKPEADESVLATAVIDVVGEGRDDVGLVGVSLERRGARRPPGSAGAPAEPFEEWQQVTSTAGAAGAAGAQAAAGSTRQLTVQSTFNLAEGKFGLKPGDELWLSAVAIDAYELDGQKHAPTRSAVRRLLIISPEELAAQVWNELAGVRRAAIRLDDEQARIQQQTSKGGESEKAQRAQAGLTDRVARERQDVAKLQSRIERNRMEDRELADLLSQASAMLDEAGKKSVEATALAEKLAKAEAAGDQPTPEQKGQAAEAQREVRDALEQLADMLDKGQDTWSTKRAIERALEEQRQLKERTENAASGTTGKADSELSPQERSELAQIGREQRALAERTAEAIEKMLRDQQEMKERGDQNASKAVEDAAKRGQRERVPDKMNQAAQQAEQNQANSATADQQQAMQSLQQMLDDLNNAGKSKDEELRRLLATIIEQIETLIEDQERQLESLTRAAALPNFAGLDAPLLKLAQNTLGVAEEAGKGPRELAPVAQMLGRAADAQGAAVALLRKEPVQEDTVRNAQEKSLDLLNKALELAKQIDEQAAEREAQRKAAELKKAYREMLTEQVAIKGETDPLVGVEATRRTRAAARALAERQQALKDRLVELQDKTAELAEAVVFEYAHRRLDQAMGQAAAALAEGDATAAVARQQKSAVQILQALVQALDNRRKDRDEFRENPEGGGGGGGGGGPQPLVPPIAQLKLLRAMQIEAAELTREAADSGVQTAIDDAGQLQQDLAARSEALLKKMLERGGPPPGGNRPNQPEEGSPQ